MTLATKHLSTASILDLWNEGKDTREIARILGVNTHESFIYNAMARLRDERADRASNRVIAFKSPKPE